MQSPTFFQKVALKYAHHAMNVAIARNFIFHFRPEVIFPNSEYKTSMLYIHIPFCHTFCPYCSFHKYIYDESLAEAYFKALRFEIESVAKRGFDFETIVVGGGTTLINESELIKTLEFCKKLFSVKEISCESDPNHIKPDKLVLFRGLITRLSCGVQSFDDDILNKLGRYSKFGSSNELVEKLSKANGILPILSLDLIFNFPTQNESQLRNDLAIAKNIAPQQITTYPLMKSPLTYKSIVNALGESTQDNEYTFYRIICEEFKGYERNNAWSFSVKHDINNETIGKVNVESSSYLTNPQFYATKRVLNDEYVSYHNQYLGVGSGAFSFMNNRLFVNAFNLKDYVMRISSGHGANIASASFKRSDILRYIFLTQLFSGIVDIALFNNIHNCDVARDLFVELNGLRIARAIIQEDNIIKCTEFGRYVVLVAMKDFYVGMDMVRAVFRDDIKCSGKEVVKIMQEV